MRVGGIVVLLLAAAMPRNTRAQEPVPRPPWRDRVTLLWEYTALKWVDPPRERGLPVFVEAGPLLQLDAKNGAGWTASFDLTHDPWLVATGPRYRRRLDRGTAFDLGACVPVAGAGAGGVEIILKAGLSHADLIGITTRWEITDHGGAAWGFGAELGSALGGAATAVTALLVAMFAFGLRGLE